MLRIGADENFNGAIVRGMLRRQRVVLTHDVTTLRQFAEDRVRAGLPMPGVFEVGNQIAIREAIEDLLLIAECSHEGEWEGQVRFLPLR